MRRERISIAALARVFFFFLSPEFFLFFLHSTFRLSFPTFAHAFSALANKSGVLPFPRCACISSARSNRQLSSEAAVVASGAKQIGKERVFSRSAILGDRR